MWTDGWQMEAKAYATSYCDGSLATAWNDSGNLYSESFEGGTTGSFTIGGGTLSNTSTNPYAGSKALLVTATGAGALATSPHIVGVTALKTYSASLRVRASAARNVQAVLYFFDAGGATVGTTFSTTATASTTAHLQLVVTAIAPSTAVTAAVAFYSNNSAAADTFTTDAYAIAEGTGLAAYRWTGAENASTSTRVTAQLVEPLASTLQAPLTVVALYRVGESAALSGLGNRHLACLSSGGTTPGVVVGGSGGVYFSDNVANQASVAVNPAPGDMLVVAATLASDAKTFQVSASLNGAAVQTGATYTAVTAYTGATSVAIGSYISGTQQADGVVEQVLLYSRALTSGEVAALVNSTAEINYASDPGIVLAAGTGVVRGTTSAETSAGTGYYRSALGALPAKVETITRSGSSPDDDAATLKVSVPTGSGVGVGDVVALNYPNTAYSYTVLRVFAPGGDYDELYL
jgi:hypothetical protein